MKKILKRFQRAFDIIRPKKIIDTLFVGYIILIIIPILILGMLFTATFTYHLSEQTKNNAQHSLKSTEEAMDSQLVSVYNISYNLMNDENILNLEKYNKSSVEGAMLYSKVETTLQKAYVQNEIIDEIYLYYENSGMVLNSAFSAKDRKYILSLFKMEQDGFSEFLRANKGKFIVADTTSQSGNEKQNILYVNSLKKKHLNNDIYYIFILNSDIIRDTIHFVNANDAGTVLLLDENYNCLMHDSKNKFSFTDEMSQLIRKLTQGATTEYVKADINRKHIYMMVKNIGLTKLKICFVLNRFHYIPMLWNIWLVIFLISLFIMVISIFIARVISRRIYRPIGNIINLFKPEHFEYGEKSEFAFVEEKYVELQAMQDEFKEYKDTQSQNIREILIYNYLKGYVGDSVSFKETAANFNIYFNASRYSVVLVKVDKMYLIAKKIQVYHYRKFIKEKIIQCFADVYPPLKDKIYEFYDGEYIGLIVCLNDTINLKNCFHKVQNILKDKLEITLSICIGDEVSDSGLLPDAYRYVCEMMRQIKLCDYGCLMTSQMYKEYNCNIDLNLFEKKLQTLVNDQKYDELNGLIDEMLTDRQLFYTDIVQIYIGIVRVLVDISTKESIAINMFINKNTLLSVDKLNSFDTVHDVAKYLKNICREISDCVINTIQTRDRTYGKIMEYISKNYMLNISLQDMAADFGFSKSYFSRYIKEVTGKNYIELLNGYRIEKAKELMNNDQNLKLFTIAEMVGFVSYRTFSAVFKRFEGISPEAYRRNNL